MNAALKKQDRLSADDVDAFVFEQIESSDMPVTAYSIVESSDAAGQPLFPTQVYRSLERLLRSRRLERVVTVNGYSAKCCQHPVHVLCSDCGAHNVVEDERAHTLLSEICVSECFKMRSTHLEISGRCRHCKLDSA